MSFVARHSNPHRFALLIVLIWSATGLRPDDARAQLSTAFTYQGQLQQSGMPETATCDFQFGLFAAASGGTALGTQAVPSVSVTNGLFTAVLNASNQLGAGAFNGSNRYLELGVCCPTGCAPSYVTLSPRQQLTATPYALYAPAAGSASALSCSGCVNSGELAAGAVTSSAIAGGTIQPSNLGFTPVLSVGAAGPLASSGGQNPAISLTGTVAIANGGTGASTAVGARANLGAAMSGANADITSLSGITGNITLAESTSALAGNILKGSTPFIHNYPSSGSGNTFVGENAGNFSLSGTSNTALGYYALIADSDGSYNTAVGSVALRSNTGNGACTGAGVPLSCCTGSGQGVCASSNTAVGAYALNANTTGASNTALGASALQDNITAANNTAVGDGTLTSATTGAANTALGHIALTRNVTGASNTAVGSSALSCTSGDTNYNTAVGEEALDADASACGSDTGTHNTAVGQLALSVNNGGSFNAALGQAALQNNTTGGANTAVGQMALVTNTTGHFNTALGVNALQSNSTADGNTAVGARSLYENDSDGSGTAKNNTAVGQNALHNNATGTGNLALGFGAGTNVVAGSNDIYIATAGSADESNAIRIGDTQSETFIAGVYNSTITDRIVYVNSNGRLGTLSSSARFKDDIVDMGDSTSGLMQLRPVRFRYKRDIDPSGSEQYGLVAEEVARVYPALVSSDVEGRPYTVRYQFLAPMLLNEVQKQARQIDAQAHQIAQLTEQTQQATQQSRQLREQAQEIAALRKQVEELATLKAATAAPPARVETLGTPRTVAKRCSRRTQDERRAAF